MHRRGLARGVRGLAAGSLTTFLALAFHVFGGGTMPGVAAIAGSLLATVWLSVMIGRRRASLPLLAAGVAAGQIVLHTVFTMSTASASISGGNHSAHGAIEFALGHAGHAMWWSHLAAGVLTVAALHRGEALLVRLGELARVAVRAITRLVDALVAAVPAARVPLASTPARPLASRRIGTVAVLRGPPAAFVI